MDSELIYGRVIACVLVVMSTWAIWKRIRSSTLLSAAGGLHLNILLFFGLGMLSYSWRAATLEREFAFVTKAWSEAGLVLALGYGVVLLLERRTQKNINPVLHITNIEPTAQTIAVLIGLWLLSVVGHLMASFEFTTSSAGTIFPVLKLFGYPALVVAVWMVRFRQPYTFVILSFIFAVSGYLAVASPWRSELILLGSSVGMGLLLKSRRFLWTAPVFFVFTLLFLLPFANEKKLHYEKVSADPVAAFVKTIDMPVDKRAKFVAEFWAKRINGGRELAFVVNGLKSGLIVLRYGASYRDALQQLVPRALWPGKPSFNQEMNYYLARRIGLVDKGNRYTSWGISYFAETVWNFGILGLIWGVPIIFLAANWLDKWAERNLRRPIMVVLVRGALFFVFMDLVGMVNVATYVLWLCLVGYSVDRILKTERIPVSRAQPVRAHVPATYKLST
jgi:hypothetical protein